MEWFYADGTHRITPWKVFCTIYPNDWFKSQWWSMYIFNNEFDCWPMMKHVYFQQCILLLAKQKENNADPILIFDQPLYQKAYEIQWKGSENSKLEIFLKMVGLHTLMSLHWSFYVFKWSSWSARNHYGSDTVPHMLSGSAISRAFQGDLVVLVVLCATIISDVYECSLQEESKKDLFSNK